MTRDETIKRLKRLDACDDALTWLRGHPAEASAEALWAACPDGEWLDWLVGRLGLDTPAYSEATAAAWRAYDEASAAAGRAYREACAPARRVYADAIRAAVPWSLVAAKLEER